MAMRRSQSLWQSANLTSSHRRKLPQSLNRQRHVSTYGYTQAKSLVYSKHGEPKDVLQMHKHSISPPHGSLVTLRTLAAPLNPADINQIQGTYPSLPSFTSTLGTSSPSAVPGNEGVFEVASAGGSVSGLAKGDWVVGKRTGLGTWRTNLQVEHDQVLRIEKDGLKPEHAATVCVNPVTAWRLLSDFASLDAQNRDWFIQNGANSGVGRAALQLARLWGIQNVAVIRDRPQDQLDALKTELKKLGATQVVTDEELHAGEFKDRIKEWTNGGREKIKLALNCVGGKPGVALAKHLASEGAHVTYGAMSKQPLALPAGMLIFKNIRFTGFWVSKWGDQNPESKADVITKVLDLARQGEFEVGPVEKVAWNNDTKVEELVSAVQGTLEGYRSGKGMFVFTDT